MKLIKGLLAIALVSAIAVSCKEAKDKAGDAMDNVEQAGEAVQDAAGDAAEAAGNAVDSVKAAAGEVVDSVKAKAADVKEMVEDASK